MSVASVKPSRMRSPTRSGEGPSSTPPLSSVPFREPMSFKSERAAGTQLDAGVLGATSVLPGEAGRGIIRNRGRGPIRTTGPACSTVIRWPGPWSIERRIFIGGTRKMKRCSQIRLLSDLRQGNPLTVHGFINDGAS